MTDVAGVIVAVVFIVIVVGSTSTIVVIVMILWRRKVTSELQYNRNDLVVELFLYEYI